MLRRHQQPIPTAKEGIGTLSEKRLRARRDDINTQIDDVGGFTQSETGATSHDVGTEVLSRRPED